MRRALLWIALSLSLLLCTATCVACAQSYRRCDRFDWNTHSPAAPVERHHYWCLRSGRGGVQVYSLTDVIYRSPATLRGMKSSPALPSTRVHIIEVPWYPLLSVTKTSHPQAHSGFGFQITSEQELSRRAGADRFVRGFTAPYWFVFLLPAIPAAACWLGLRAIRRRDQRARTGHCVRCGYDLRASIGRCPECGTPLSSPSTRLAEAEPTVV